MAVVTGLGAVSSLGHGTDAVSRALATGTSGIRRIRRFSTDGFGVHIGALVPAHDEPGSGAVPSTDLCHELALAAAREACADAGLPLDSAGAPLALVLGTSGTHGVPAFRQTERLARALHLRGPCISVATACAASTNALGIALDLLRSGQVDAVLAGGADVLTPLLFAGFHALGVLSPEPCAPFSERLGTTLGEGAGFLVLERRASARARGATVRGVIAGYGIAADAHHDTSPDPLGRGVARAIQSALLHAALARDDVGYVNAHATGTAANDPAEWRALQQVFGARARQLPVSGSKGLLGHAQAAAGVLEVIVTLLSMERELVPQTLGLESKRANSPSDTVAQSTPRSLRYTHAVCTNSAFGGANAALVLAHAGAANETSPTPLRPVYVAGIARVAAATSLDADCPDASTQQLKSASSLALADAGIGPLRGTRQEQSGLVLGINTISPSSAAALDASIAQRGLPRLSAHAFARMVLNAPAGTCTRAFGLRGPLSTVSAGRASGLLALIYAAELLATREDVSLMVAAGVHEATPAERLRAAPPREGAAACVLARAPHDAAIAVELAGWAIAGPGELDEVVARVLARVKLGPEPVRSFDDGPAREDDDSCSAVASADALLRATECLRRGEAPSALVTCNESSSLCCAVALVARPAAAGGGDRDD